MLSAFYTLVVVKSKLGKWSQNTKSEFEIDEQRCQAMSGRCEDESKAPKHMQLCNTTSSCWGMQIG